MAAPCGAVEALAVSLAVELAPIHVNVVRPGRVTTPNQYAAVGEDRDAALNKIVNTLPSRRLGVPEDIAEAVLYLMNNRYTTGTILTIDGSGPLV